MQDVKDNQRTEKKEQPQSSEARVPEENEGKTVAEVKEKPAVESKEEPVSEYKQNEDRVGEERTAIHQSNETEEKKVNKKTSEENIPDEPEQKKHAGGRPKKVTKRLQKLIFRIDEDTYTKLMFVKAINKIDLQDVVFSALKSFLDDHYSPGTGLDEEANSLIKKIKEEY